MAACAPRSTGPRIGPKNPIFHFFFWRREHVLGDGHRYCKGLVEFVRIGVGSGRSRPWRCKGLDVMVGGHKVIFRLLCTLLSNFLRCFLSLPLLLPMWSMIVGEMVSRWSGYFTTVSDRMYAEVFGPWYCSNYLALCLQVLRARHVAGRLHAEGLGKTPRNPAESPTIGLT